MTYYIKASGTTGLGTAIQMPMPDLISNVDHISGLTGQIGTPYLTRYNALTNTYLKGLMTYTTAEIDQTNAPGQYALNFTPTEIQYPGWIQGYLKLPSSDPLSFRIELTQDDPQTTIKASQATVNALGGTPALTNAVVNTINSNTATLQTSVNALGGTPAINRGLLATLQTSVNAVGGTPANLIVGGQFTTLALANAPSGSGAITTADAAALRTAAAIIGGTNTNPALRTYQYTQSDGKTVTVTVAADGQTKTTSVA